MRRILILAGLLITGVLGANTLSTDQTLGRHVFEIPDDNNIPGSATPFFLPAPDPGDGFSFILNPEAELPNQNLIGVDSKDRICARAARSEARINATVCAVTPLLWRGRSLRNVGDKVFWSYNLATAAVRKPVSPVSCFSTGDGDGLCTGVLPYGDLVLTIHLRDDQIDSLENLYDQADAKLKSWERTNDNHPTKPGNTTKTL